MILKLKGQKGWVYFEGRRISTTTGYVTTIGPQDSEEYSDRSVFRAMTNMRDLKAPFTVKKRDEFLVHTALLRLACDDAIARQTSSNEKSVVKGGLHTVQDIDWHDEDDEWPDSPYSTVIEAVRFHVYGGDGDGDLLVITNRRAYLLNDNGKTVDTFN